MAIYRTDRDRRIIGDRILARKASFGEIHAAVAEVFDTFAAAHAELAKSFEARQKEESDDQKARRMRDEAFAQVTKHYSWAYQQLDQLLAPNWDDEPDEADLRAIRDALFPVGTPSVVSASAQLALDGMTHFLAALPDHPSLSYPEAFVQDARGARDNLQEAIHTVTRDTAETRAESARHFEARRRWDRLFAALRDVATGFLRIEGREAEIAVLFRALPRRSSGTAAEEATLTVEPLPAGDGAPAE